MLPPGPCVSRPARHGGQCHLPVAGHHSLLSRIGLLELLAPPYRDGQPRLLASPPRWYPHPGGASFLVRLRRLGPRQPGLERASTQPFACLSHDHPLHHSAQPPAGDGARMIEADRRSEAVTQRFSCLRGVDLRVGARGLVGSWGHRSGKSTFNPHLQCLEESRIGSIAIDGTALSKPNLPTSI